MNHENQPPQEKEPVSYEQALDAVKSLRLTRKDLSFIRHLNVTHYGYSDVQSAFDIVVQWESECDLLGKRDIDDVEKAENIIKASTILIEAGYTELKYIRDAIDFLNGEYAYETNRRKGKEDEVTEKLKEAIGLLEEKIEQDYPKEKPSEKIEQVVKEIIDKANSKERADIVDAVRLMATTVSVNNSEYINYFKTEEGKKKFEYLKKLEPIVDQIYKGMMANKPINPKNLLGKFIDDIV
jgi:hypothetical protein